MIVKFCSNSTKVQNVCTRCMYYVKDFRKTKFFRTFLRFLDIYAVWEYPIFFKRSKERAGRTKYLDS